MNLNTASDTRLHRGIAPTPGLPLRLLPRHMLLVGVDESQQAPALDILARWDVAAEVASNGAEALQIASAGEFDLILIDAKRSILDGVFMCSRLRRLEREQKDKARPPVALVAKVGGDWPSCEAVLRMVGVNDLLKGYSAAAAVRECLRRWCLGSYRPTWLVS